MTGFAGTRRAQKLQASNWNFSMVSSRKLRPLILFDPNIARCSFFFFFFAAEEPNFGLRPVFVTREADRCEGNMSPHIREADGILAKGESAERSFGPAGGSADQGGAPTSEKFQLAFDCVRPCELHRAASVFLFQGAHQKGRPTPPPPPQPLLPMRPPRPQFARFHQCASLMSHQMALQSFVSGSGGKVSCHVTKQKKKKHQHGFI